MVMNWAESLTPPHSNEQIHNINNGNGHQNSHMNHAPDSNEINVTSNIMNEIENEFNQNQMRGRRESVRDIDDLSRLKMKVMNLRANATSNQNQNLSQNQNLNVDQNSNPNSNSNFNLNSGSITSSNISCGSANNGVANNNNHSSGNTPHHFNEFEITDFCSY
ncbi:unnamed protein product [[Candida] boidinii]|nr:unnamed protein product [[Candida] boidinii]